MSTREIVGHIQELHGIDVLPDLILAVTDAVLEEIGIWQARPLELVYPLVFFDALRVKIRDKGLVRNKTVQVALGVTAEPTVGPRSVVFTIRNAGRTPGTSGGVAGSLMCPTGSGGHVLLAQLFNGGNPLQGGITSR
jgi:hypothetical protein